MYDRLSYIAGSSGLTFRLRGRSLKVFACRTFLSAPMATKNAGSREEKYIFHRKKNHRKKIIFSRRIFGSKFFSHCFSQNGSLKNQNRVSPPCKGADKGLVPRQF